ncbi:hypothetical protein ACFQY0_18765 [Haloferula chungangensis]|uniref:Uncharacterized protein n=1 Tax=Haloferula chungangensis TaxID=1048331 RepID=A0ABW2LA00_9BACT
MLRSAASSTHSSATGVAAASLKTALAGASRLRANGFVTLYEKNPLDLTSEVLSALGHTSTDTASDISH